MFPMCTYHFRCVKSKNACTSSDNDRGRILVEKNERDVVFGRRTLFRYSFYDLVRTVQHVEVES